MDNRLPPGFKASWELRFGMTVASILLQRVENKIQPWRLISVLSQRKTNRLCGGGGGSIVVCYVIE
jgi:hypothetical protein